MGERAYTEKSVSELAELDDVHVKVLCTVVASRESGEFYISILKDATGVITAVGKKPMVEGKTYEVFGRVYRKRDGVQLGVDEFSESGHKIDFADVALAKTVFEYPEMGRARGKIEAMAWHFTRIAGDGKKIVVKYHCDADGLGSALIIYRMFKCLRADPSFSQSNAAVYEIADVIRDIMHNGSAHYILLDFGNNPESQAGLDLLAKTAHSIAIIDHHPSERKVGDELVLSSPAEGLGSEHTTGLLCYEVARMACNADYGKLHLISLCGDRSTLEFGRTQGIEETALVLDYIASTAKRERHGIRFINSLVDDPEMVHTIYLSATDKIDIAVGVAANAAKRKALGNGILLVSANVEKVAEQGSFPPKGKITGGLHDSMCARGEDAVVTLGYGSDSVMIRANDAAVQRGFDANRVIREMKARLGEIILSGGGHPRAAAIRFRKGFMKTVLDALADKIGELPGSASNS